MAIEDIRPKADEVASLIAARFGGLKRGHQAELETMMRKRGGALPRRLRREAWFMAQADRMAGQPRLARQVDRARFDRAHRALIAYLRPLGQGARLRSRAVGIGASIVLGLMLLAALVVWLMTARGLLPR